MGHLAVGPLDSGLRYRRHLSLVRFDDGLDALEGLAHVTDVATAPQLATQHRVELGEGAVAHPERLGDVGAAVDRPQPVVPVVDRRVADEHFEAELAAWFTGRDSARGP